LAKTQQVPFWLQSQYILFYSGLYFTNIYNYTLFWQTSGDPMLLEPQLLTSSGKAALARHSLQKHHHPKSQKVGVSHDAAAP
jgi:hypothetical protein